MVVSSATLATARAYRFASLTRSNLSDDPGMCAVLDKSDARVNETLEFMNVVE
jgi:hypothetical protein